MTCYYKAWHRQNILTLAAVRSEVTVRALALVTSEEIGARCAIFARISLTFIDL